MIHKLNKKSAPRARHEKRSYPSVSSSFKVDRFSQGIGRDGFYIPIRRPGPGRSDNVAFANIAQ